MDLRAFEAVLLDLDGTVYREEHALPGAVELLRELRGAGRKYACLSNSTSSPEQVRQRLGRMKVEIDAEHIYTACQGAADYVLERCGAGCRVYNLATEGFEEILEGKVRWVRGKEETADVVVVGTPASLYATEERQFEALALLKKGAALVGMCADRIYPSPRGLELGSGALTEMMAYAANVRPFYTGKPQAVFFQTLCQRLGVRPEGCVLVGDNLESDIAGAHGVGMTAVLALSGITRREEVRDGLPEGQRPDLVIEDLREWVGKVG